MSAAAAADTSASSAKGIAQVGAVDARPKGASGVLILKVTPLLRHATLLPGVVPHPFAHSAVLHGSDYTSATAVVGTYADGVRVPGREGASVAPQLGQGPPQASTLGMAS